MAAPHLLPVFAVGLAGSVHCIGMCGGIVGALSGAGSARAPSIPIVAAAPALPTAAALDGTRRLAGTCAANAGPARTLLPPRLLAYNAGRIASYMAAGALAGGLANGAASLARIAQWQGIGYLLANAMLVALGLYLMNAWHGLARLEVVGQLLWRRLLPLLRLLLPMDSLPKAFALGGLWGWVPCGMVYSVLLTALLSGSASGGASVMLAFGLGTLPVLLTLGLAGARLRQAMQHPLVRAGCGMLVLGFGVLGLVRHAAGLPHGWFDALCVAASA